MSGIPLHSVSVAGVAFDAAGRVLLIKRRDNGEWQAPGGILERDETFEQGVAREVLEETGVRVKVEYLSGVYKNLQRGVVALVYRCTPLDGVPMPSAESAEVEWVDLNDALQRMPKVFAIRVQDAKRSIATPSASRAHDGTSLL